MIFIILQMLKLYKSQQALLQYVAVNN